MTGWEVRKHQTIAPQQGVTGVASQASTHGVRKLATTLTGGSAGTEAHFHLPKLELPTFATRPASGDTSRGLGARPGPIRRDWATTVCFSGGKAAHGVGRCPQLNETFPFMLTGWTAEKVGSSHYLAVSDRGTSSGGKRTLISEGGGGGGGEPPGSVMEFDPMTPVVVRYISFHSGMRPWYGWCYN